MSHFAIIHTATRVIRRLTVDPEPFVADDETAVAVPSSMDLANFNGMSKLDDAGEQVAASAEEAQLAGLGE